MDHLSSLYFFGFQYPTPHLPSLPESCNLIKQNLIWTPNTDISMGLFLWNEGFKTYQIKVWVGESSTSYAHENIDMVIILWTSHPGLFWLARRPCGSRRRARRGWRWGWRECRPGASNNRTDASGGIQPSDRSNLLKQAKQTPYSENNEATFSRKT